MSDEPGLRERKNARTQEAIERAALELALEQGYDHTTVDQIAERADVSPRTVFTRFPNKEAIVFGLPGEVADTFVPILGRGEGDLLDRLTVFLRTYAESRSDLEALRSRALQEDPFLRGQLRARLEPIEHVVAATLADDLGFATDDAGVRVFASGVVGLLLTIVDYTARHPEAEDPVADCQAGIDVLRVALDKLHARQT